MAESLDLTGDTSIVKVILDFDDDWDNLMQPQLTEQHIFSGTTKTFTFTINQNGAAMNLTGMTVGFGAKIAVDPTASFIFNKACTITDATNGVVIVTLADSDAVFGSYIAELAVHGPGYNDVAIQFPLIIDQSLGV